MHFGQLFEAHLDLGSAEPKAVRVRIDQRDHAAYEGSEIYDADARMDDEGNLHGQFVTKLRHLTFTALKRAGSIDSATKWGEFNDRLLIQTQAVPDGTEGEETGEEGDPTPAT